MQNIIYVEYTITNYKYRKETILNCTILKIYKAKNVHICIYHILVLKKIYSGLKKCMHKMELSSTVAYTEIVQLL